MYLVTRVFGHRRYLMEMPAYKRMDRLIIHENLLSRFRRS